MKARISASAPDSQRASAPGAGPCSCRSVSLTIRRYLQRSRIWKGAATQPDDIARVVAFLAGPDSGWMTGQVLRADGGLLP
ncbi:MAG: SDR family oxidoreductase [Streptosporangiaceae bacterium]